LSFRRGRHDHPDFANPTIKNCRAIAAAATQLLRFPYLQERAINGIGPIAASRLRAIGLYYRTAMARDLRPNICGGVYHVMNRGNRKALIFEDNRDRKRFVSLLIRLLCLFEVELLIGCLMGNHFHLVVMTPRGNLSAFMQQLEGQFATYSNWRHQRVGHLFQGRFRCVLIESDVQLLTAACYVFLNPVVAGFCGRAEQWRWSTFAATVGITSVPEYLSLQWLGDLFPAPTLEASQRLFRALMNEACPVQKYLAQSEWFDVCEPLAQVLRSYIGDRLRSADLPRQYRALWRPSLDEIFAHASTAAERNDAILDAHVTYGYSCAEIASVVSLKSTSVGNIVSSVRRQRRFGK
jgi:putative transposase